MIRTATVPQGGRYVPQSAPEFFRRATAFQRDADQRRAALALGVTFRLAGINSGKRAALVLEASEATASRHMDGGHDSPVSRVREYLRKLNRGGAFPAPILADLLADAWRDTVAGKSMEELRDHMKELHRAEQEADSRVDRWQVEDLCGVRPESEDEVDEAILAQTARLLEMYATRQEIRAKTDR